MVVKEKQIGKYLVEVVVDESPDNPRDWDNLGTMVCFHGRYRLGDKHDYSDNDYNGWDEMKKDIIKNENVGVILPLYLYDHSGITISTSPFSCRWDSGQIGFIFISKKKMLEEYGGKIVTQKLKERVEGYLKSEVETYDRYLQGDVYGYKVYKVDNEDKEEVESCYGYYGEVEEVMEEGERVVENLMKKEVVTEGDSVQ